MAFVSFLNSRTKYKQQPYKWLNLLFFLYMLFIVWERTRQFKFSALAELLINDAEHILFAVIISILIAQLLTLFKGNYNTARITMQTILIFNAVGVLNECSQNALGQRPVFIFIPDSQKDMLMNLCGTAVFILVAILIRGRKVKNLPAAKLPA